MAFPSVRKVGALLNIGAGPLLLGTFLIWIAYRNRAGVFWSFAIAKATSEPSPVGAAAAPSITPNAPGAPVTFAGDESAAQWRALIYGAGSTSNGTGAVPVPAPVPLAAGGANAPPATLFESIMESLNASTVQ